MPLHPQRGRLMGLPFLQDIGPGDVLGAGPRRGSASPSRSGRSWRIAGEFVGQLPIHGEHPPEHWHRCTSAPRSPGRGGRSGSPSGRSSASPAIPPGTLHGCCGASRSEPPALVLLVAAAAAGGEIAARSRPAPDGGRRGGPSATADRRLPHRLPAAAAARRPRSSARRTRPSSPTCRSSSPASRCSSPTTTRWCTTSSPPRPRAPSTSASPGLTQTRDGELPQPRAGGRVLQHPRADVRQRAGAAEPRLRPGGRRDGTSSSATFRRARYPLHAWGRQTSSRSSGGDGGRDGQPAEVQLTRQPARSSTRRTSTSSGGPTRSGPATRHEPPPLASSRRVPPRRERGRPAPRRRRHRGRAGAGGRAHRRLRPLPRAGGRRWFARW